MLLILCQPVCTPSKQRLQQLYTNGSKFNCENRIFLSYTWGQPETASGKCMRKTPQFYSSFTPEKCPLWERGSTLAVSWWFCIQPFLSSPWHTLHSHGGKSKEAEVYLLWGRNAKGGKTRTRNWGELQLWVPEEQYPTRCPRLSPVSIFIALQFQFTGSSGNQGQGQGCDWGKDWGKGLLELTGFTQASTSLISKVQITPDNIPQAHPTWPSPSLHASRNLWLANVTSPKSKERGWQQALSRRNSNQGSYLKPKACFPEHSGRGDRDFALWGGFEATLW